MEAGAVQETRAQARAVSSAEAVQFIDQFLAEHGPSKSAGQASAVDDATADQLQRVIASERESATQQPAAAP